MDYICSRVGTLLSSNSSFSPLNESSNVYEFTQHLAESILADKFIPLNQTSSLLGQLNGSKNGVVSTFGSVEQESNIDFSKIHQFLKSIPIYSEVLGFQIKDSMNLGPKQNAHNNNQKKMVNQMMNESMSARVNRKRTTEFFLSELSASGNNSPSIAKSKKINLIALNSDYSSTYSAEYMDRIDQKPSSSRLDGAGEQSKFFLSETMDLEAAVSATQNIGSANTIYIPKGADIKIPEGYIKIDTDRCASRKTKEVTHCEHVDRKHYAKGLCSTCYHKGGRTKLAWNCEHRDELHYAKGCCQECYLQFHSKRGKKLSKKIALNKKSNNDLNELLKLSSSDSFDELAF